MRGAARWRRSASRSLASRSLTSLSVAAIAGHSSAATPLRLTNFLHASGFAECKDRPKTAGARPVAGSKTASARPVTGSSHSPDYCEAMTEIETTTVPENRLPVYKVALPGTRALTVLVAFDAGARNEQPEENGMAHFLEHLVFKGGEKYATYKDVNETAERLGGVLNAYTSHDLVAFHITVRAESAPAAIDLLSDFVGRPRIDAEELDRERGVVIQEINRAYDQPSMVAEYLIDRAAFGEQPLGRTVLGPEENLRSFTREGIVAFRERRWAGSRGGPFLAGNLEHLPPEEELQERFSRFPALPEPDPYVPAPAFAPQKLVEQRETTQ